MVEEKEKKTLTFTDLFIGMAISAVVGAIVAYLILRNQQQSLQLQQKYGFAGQPIQQYIDWKPLENLPLSIPDTIPASMLIQQPIQQTVSPQTVSPQTVSPISYKNTQKTSFVFDKDGDMVGIETTRDATIDK